MKRPAPADSDGAPSAAAQTTGGGPVKRMRKQQHHLKHKQQYDVEHPVLAQHDKTFFRSQLMRSITLTLAAAGFDSAKPSAIEMMLNTTEIYIRHFLRLVRVSMESSRRTMPTPDDLIHALAKTNPHSSDLLPHLRLPLQPFITQPHLYASAPPAPETPDLDGVLGNELSGKQEGRRRNWIPAHLPSLPSRHAWQSTPVYTERDDDSRQVREKVAQEGELAEQALRRLKKAAQAGRAGHQRSKAALKEESLYAAAMQGILADEEARRKKEVDAMEIAFGEDVDADAEGDEGEDVMLPDAATGKRGSQENGRASGKDPEYTITVNWETKHWRKNAASASTLG